MTRIRPQAVVDAALLLSDLGVSDAENAAISGVAVKTIRRWRRLYQREGRPRGNANASAVCPRCAGGPLDEAAYAELLGWYLGDGHISWSGKGIPLLTIVNDNRYTDLTLRVLNLIAAVKVNGTPFVRERIGSVAVCCGWHHWPCLFPQHGAGRKHERPIVLAEWQREIVQQQPGLFLRGLIHADGCRVANWATTARNGVTKRWDYTRYLFSNASPDIRGLFGWTLDLLDLPHTHPSEREISIARKAAVAKLDEFVGPKS